MTDVEEKSRGNTGYGFTMAEVQVIMRMAVMYRGRSARDNKGLLSVAVLHVRKRGEILRDTTHTAQICICCENVLSKLKITLSRLM